MAVKTTTGMVEYGTAPEHEAIHANNPVDELWRQYHANPEAGENLAALVQAYLPLVSRVLKGISIHLPPHVAIEDLQQAGMVGLYQAVVRYDPAVGQEFSRFAWSRIRGAVMDELRVMDHLSRGRRTQIKRVEASVETWLQSHGAMPTEEDLARTLEVSTTELGSLVAQSLPILSLNDFVANSESGSGMTILERLADTEQTLPSEEAEKQEMRRHLRRAFRELSDREQKVLYLYYYEELRLSEIGALFEVTEARICQIHAMALVKLKVLLKAIRER